MHMLPRPQTRRATPASLNHPRPRANCGSHCGAVGIGWSGAAVVAIGGPAIVCCDSYDVAAITRPRCSPGRRPWALLVCLQ